MRIQLNIYKLNTKKALFIAAKHNNINVFLTLIKYANNIYIKGLRNDKNESLISYSARYLSGNIIDEIIDNNDQLLEVFIATYLKTNKLKQKTILTYDNHNIFIEGNYKSIPKSLSDEVLDKENLPKKSSFVELMNKLFDYDSKHEKLINVNRLLPKGKLFFTVINSNYSELEKVSDFLIKIGVDMDQLDKSGIYPLEHAISINSIELVTSLINSNKVNLNTKLKNGLTYLHLAVRNKNTLILSLILQQNIIDINHLDENDDTPLLEACKAKCIDNINLLFKNDNLDYLHCNKNGKDAFGILLISLPRVEEESIKSDKEKYQKLLISTIEELLSSNK